jgi:hypothetical protein
MDSQINDLILSEIQGMRKELNEGFTETKQRITAIETNTTPFFETDGGKDKIQEQLDDLKKSKWMVMGGAGVLSGTITGLVHTITKKLGI